MNVAVLTKIIKETDKNWRFIFESPLYNKIDFIPGQLVQLVAMPGEEESVVRNYSVASWPDGTNKFELIITYLQGGAMSEYLFNDAKVGDEFAYRGPMGVFTLTNDIEVRDIFFVSTGSGISPFRSMLGWINENNIELKHNVKLFFGTRTKKDLLYYDEMLEYQKNIPNFEYVPCLSREKWEGYNGYVHGAYLPEITSAETKPLVYFCGWNKMIAEGRDYLKDLDYKMGDDIRVEIFG